MHLEPLFNDFSFGGLGGPWADLPAEATYMQSAGERAITGYEFLARHASCARCRVGGADRAGVCQGGGPPRVID